MIYGKEKQEEGGQSEKVDRERAEEVVVEHTYCGALPRQLGQEITHPHLRFQRTELR